MEPFKNIFFEIHWDLPREAPGDDESTRRAFSLLEELPDHPRILDLGCGPGAQTLALARLSDVPVLALDLHLPFLQELKRRAQAAGLTKRVAPLNMSMQALGLAPGRFDLIWSEGAIYIPGFKEGLRACQALLKPGGYAAVTELTWLKPNPPAEIQRFWETGYPQMSSVAANRASIQALGYQDAGHFTLPESSWWDSYYGPLDARLAMLRKKYRGDEQALLILADAQVEIDMYRKYSDWYGYVFYLMRKATNP